MPGDGTRRHRLREPCVDPLPRPRPRTVPLPLHRPAWRRDHRCCADATRRSQGPPRVARRGRLLARSLRDGVVHDAGPPRPVAAVGHLSRRRGARHRHDPTETEPHRAATPRSTSASRPHRVGSVGRSRRRAASRVEPPEQHVPVGPPDSTAAARLPRRFGYCRIVRTASTKRTVSSSIG